MLARSHRLPNARTVKQLYAKGRRFSAPTVFIHVALSTARTVRAAVVCGRKVHKLATVRNRLKRVARSVLEAYLLELPNGHDFLVTLRPPAAGHEAQLRAELNQLLVPYVRRKHNDQFPMTSSQ